ncbi:tetratricopeptide repeat protein [Acidianus brierleyi]|uniref:Tetratricopeptide repeat protein n=1 Tax=Acidianus brierleyi TaxID=41673 RepID=A0A2U9IDT6_9CREN|nr:tetratricopeptide repeat protein [Acidianus brierleyi]AWR94159.1 tetratricopeptide repeat protein [Acidianus brierleyi]
MSQLEDIISQYNSGNLNYALRKIQELISSNPSKEAYQLLGKILLDMGREEEALEAFNNAGDKINAAKILINRIRYTDALQLLEGINEPEARLLRAMAYLKLEQYEKVLDELKEISGEYLNSPIFYKIKGITEYFLGNYYDSIKDLSKAISLYGFDADLFYYRALCHMSLNNDKDAEKDFDTAINLNPYYAEAYFGKGIMKEKKGKFEEAVKLYTRSISINPNYKGAYVRRAKTYMKMGMEDEAIKDIDKVKEIEDSKNKKDIH